jgi:hypothetical protein
MVIESPNKFQTLQTSDSDTESIAEAVTLFSSQSATLIQTTFRSYRQRNIYSSLKSRSIPIMSTTSTDYEFPGGFKVAVNLSSPIVNTDGLSAGRLYKKENRPTEGSKEEKELLSDIKTNRYSKYKVMNISLKDPEKLASNLSILDNLTYTQQFMLEYNMEDPYHICFPTDPNLPTLLVDSSNKPIAKDLFKDHRDITVEEVAFSNRWYSRYAIFTTSNKTDRSFAKELEWSHLHFRSHVEQELYNALSLEIKLQLQRIEPCTANTKVRVLMVVEAMAAVVVAIVGPSGDRWSKWKRPRPEENNKRIINNAPFTWNQATRRWSKDNTPPGPSGLSAGMPSPPPSQQKAGDDQSRNGTPFPPTSIGQDEVSQVSDSVNPSDLATLQLQLANLINMVNKIGG